MSTSIARDIQRLAGLDEPSTTLLRSFDLEWRCGTRFIKTLLLAGYNPPTIGTALTEALQRYQRMCQQGVADYERLKFVLGHLYRALERADQRPGDDLTARWGRHAYVPSEVTEYLIQTYGAAEHV